MTGGPGGNPPGVMPGRAPAPGGDPSQLVKLSGDALNSMSNQMQDFSKIMADVAGDAGKKTCVGNEYTAANGLMRAATNANSEVISYSGQGNYASAQNSLNIVLTSKEKLAGALQKARTCAAGVSGGTGEPGKTDVAVDTTGQTGNVSTFPQPGIAGSVGGGSPFGGVGGVGGSVGAEAGGPGSAGGVGTLPGTATTPNIPPIKNPTSPGM